MKKRDPLLEERESTHGKFSDNAGFSQAMKLLCRQYGARDLCPEQREALDMIAAKIGRILAGRAKHKDHWIDVAGYALLGAEACKKK